MQVAGAKQQSMLTLSDTWMDLFGLAGLINPFALIIGAILGWYADQAKKILVAGFAAAALSLIIETAISFTGLPVWGEHDAGALALFPFRFVGGLIACGLVYLVARRLRR